MITQEMEAAIRIKRRELIAYLRQQFQIDWFGHHGIPHWARVRVNGLLLSKQLNTNAHVAELFAFFHDACRHNEYEDHDHGARGAALAYKLRGSLFEASDEEMELLEFACTHHSGGHCSNSELTVMVCWDADRLDLGRVGITPSPKYLCTSLARTHDFIIQAHYRALVWKENYKSSAHRSQNPGSS